MLLQPPLSLANAAGTFAPLSNDTWLPHSSAIAPTGVPPLIRYAPVSAAARDNGAWAKPAAADAGLFVRRLAPDFDVQSRWRDFSHRRRRVPTARLAPDHRQNGRVRGSQWRCVRGQDPRARAFESEICIPEFWRCIPHLFPPPDPRGRREKARCARSG